MYNGTIQIHNNFIQIQYLFQALLLFLLVLLHKLVQGVPESGECGKGPVHSGNVQLLDHLAVSTGQSG